ncbi:MAG: Fe-S cluster assembly protein SufD [Rhizobiaceae bacterium]
MTVHNPRTLTDAETFLIEAYSAADWLAGDDKVRASRDTAIEALKTNGLPTRRVEAFHYTDLRANLAKGYSPSQRPNSDLAAHAMLDYERLIPAVRLPMVNGYYFADMADDLPEGVSVIPGFQSGDFGSSVVALANTVETLNTAFTNDGVSISFAADSTVAGNIGIANSYVGEEGGMAVTRNKVSVGKNAKGKIVDRFCGNNGVAYLSSSVVNITIEEGATLNYTLVIEEGDMAQRLARLSVELKDNATLNLFVLNGGGKLVRQEIYFEVKGENVALNISGVNLIGGDALIDVTSVINHHTPNTVSNEIFRNVVTGRGKGVFQGQINVAQAAQLTDARMACNTLLLSDDCDFSAKPELEIFADDVQCAHGATVTDLEESYLFYLMARGISKEAARRMLIKAFVAEVVEEMDDEALVEALESRIDVWMEKHV